MTELPTGRAIQLTFRVQIPEMDGLTGVGIAKSKLTTARAAVVIQRHFQARSALMIRCFGLMSIHTSEAGFSFSSWENRNG